MQEEKRLHNWVLSSFESLFFRYVKSLHMLFTFSLILLCFFNIPYHTCLVQCFDFVIMHIPCSSLFVSRYNLSLVYVV